MNRRIHIETGTPEGNALGFTEDLFSGWLEYDPSCNRLYLHYIISRIKNEGNVTNLIKSWLAKDFEVRVVMPRPIMQHILTNLFFMKMMEEFPDQYTEPVEVWISTMGSYHVR